MQQVIVELDDRTAMRLNEIAPPRARKRSEFIREAIRRALNGRLERQMERAYRETPQDALETDLDPSAWEPAPSVRRKRKKGRR